MPRYSDLREAISMEKRYFTATLDLGEGKRRCCTRSGVSFGVVHRFILLLVCFSGVVLFVANLFRAFEGIESTSFSRRSTHASRHLEESLFENNSFATMMAFIELGQPE
jgi:hypothetical protein